MKKVLIINGHPDPLSYNQALFNAYKEGAATTDAIISEINIGSLQFDPNLRYGYRQRMELEPDLLDALEKIKAADHMVWVFPMWWFGYPAVMKGFIDRAFLPGITLKMIPGKVMPQQLLKGKTGRIIITADTPRWYDRFFMHSPVINQFKKGTLALCGISPVKVHYIAPVREATPAFLQQHLDKVYKLGVLLQ